MQDFSDCGVSIASSNGCRIIYLLRHGEPEFGETGRVCLGRKNPPLSPKGREQVGLLKSYFSDITLSGIYHSEMTRCRQTAELLKENTKIFPISDIEEVDMGEWEGLTFEEIRRTYPKLYELRGFDPENVAPPGGESLGEAGRRFESAFFGLLKRTGGDIAVVAHAGVNRMLLGSLLDLSTRESLQIAQPYGCVNQLQWDNKVLRVLDIGIIPQCHIKGQVNKRQS